MGAFDWQVEGFTCQGFSGLNAMLDGLTKIQYSHGMSPVLEKALSPMCLVAVSLAPDDPHTGPPHDLKSSITVSTHQRSSRNHNRALGQYEARAYMGPTGFGYPEAIMMEFGTIYDQAQPYMRPAWDSMKQGALNIIRDGFANQVFSTAKRYHLLS